jgi:hypothetical protein
VVVLDHDDMIALDRRRYLLRDLRIPEEFLGSDRRTKTGIENGMKSPRR